MLILTYLLVFFALAAFLWASSTWFQGYIYSEPDEHLYWRAPAAAAGITLFLAFWGFLAYRAPGDYPAQFQFTSQGATRVFERMKAVYADGKNERTVEVKLVLGQRATYVDAQNQPLRSRPLAVIVTEEDGQEVRFNADKDAKGYFAPDPIYGLYYRDDQGRTMTESSLGELETTRRGLLFFNLFLNLLHLGVWFACCWLLLRYQWSHALGVAAVLWLIMSIAIVEMLVRRVERARKERDAAATTWVIPPPGIRQARSVSKGEQQSLLALRACETIT